MSAAEQSRCSLGPWRAIRCASSWRIYDQQGNAIARLATTEITEPRRAYDARLMARAPELEMMLAECAGMLGAAADSLKGRGARYTIPTRMPLWQRLWNLYQLHRLREQLKCLQDERDGYLQAATMPGSEFKLGPKYLENCAEQERQLQARIAVLEVMS